MQEVLRKRPLGVTIIAIMEIFAAITLLLASLGVITTVIGVVAAIGIIFQLIVAWGLWTLKSWAFWTTAILEVFHILYNLYSLLIGHNSPIATVIVGLIINLVILVYLFVDRNVRAAFRT